MKVVAFEVDAWEAEAFEEMDGDVQVEISRDPLRPELADRFADARVISTFINCRLDADVLRRFDNLGMIATRSTGFDHIDLDHCRENGVVVCNVPTYGSHTVAEHVFALLLTISHRLEEAIDRTRKGDFRSRGLQGFDLRGRTIGVIGTGDIGLCVAQIARGFGMEVLAFDVVHNDEAAERLGFRYCELDNLLAASDVVTLHVPANEKTRHMMGADQFARMPAGSVLINTARGELVEIRSLLRALADGHLAAAGLDVLPEEPVIREEAELLRSVIEREHNLDTLLADHVLTHMRNVVITPHSAFNTREAVQRIIDTTIENIGAYAGGEPVNRVDDRDG